MLRGKIFFIFLFAIILFMPFASALIVINELMPHSNNSLTDEWVELYNPATINITLEGWKIGDTNSNDTINITIYSQGFAIIVDSSANFNGSSGCNIFSSLNLSNLACIELTEIGSGLNDAADTVFLYDNNSVLFGNFTWTDNLKTSGLSFGLNNSAKWATCFPTPGMPNNCTIQQNQLPIVNFTYSPQNPVVSQIVTFDASSSYDADGNITLYSWNFGDGTSIINITNITAEHSFSTAGNFNINLTVTDSNNSQSSITKIISITSNQTQQNITQNCLLEITYAPSEAYFGSTIEINISVYRNDTAKYAVYLYIEDNEGEDVTDTITFHADNKSSNHTFNASLEIDKECNVTNKTFMIVLRGLDEKINKSITLKENSTLCLPDFQYIITPVTTAKINETFTTKVKIINNKNTDTKFDVWSYVYISSHCYSCTTDDREENLNYILVEAKSSAEVLLYNTVNNAEPGNYSLKVKILKENLKTPKEYTFTIIFEASTATEQTAGETNLNIQSINNTNKTEKGITGKTIYKSKIELNKKRVEIILISILLLTVLYFLFRQKILRIMEYRV